MQTQLLRTENFLWLGMFLRCNSNTVRSYSLLQLKRSNQFDATASAGLFQWEIKQVSIYHLHQQVKVTCFTSHRKGLEVLMLSNLAIQQQGNRAKRGRSRQDSSSGACQKIKGVEKAGNHCPLFLQVPGLQHHCKYLHEERQDMKMGQKQFALGSQTTLAL